MIAENSVTLASTRLARRRSDGHLMVVSHGSEGGPYYCEYDYREDVMQIRRAI